MRPVNVIHLRVFCNPEEDREEIKRTFLLLLGYDLQELEKEKLALKETAAKGFNQRTIVVFEAALEKERHCNKFLKKLNDGLSPEDRSLILEQENRLDDNMNFFIRLAKDSLLDGKYALTDSGNCFHIALNINAHPRKREVALTSVREIFKTEQ
jgi:RNA binding exosome subunit